MRGDDQQLQAGMFSYVALEDRIPANHPLREKQIEPLKKVKLRGLAKVDRLLASPRRP
jgi:hypothetical protein